MLVRRYQCCRVVKPDGPREVSLQDQGSAGPLHEQLRNRMCLFHERNTNYYESMRYEIKSHEMPFAKFDIVIRKI
jgi:hypothetical protein